MKFSMIFEGVDKATKVMSKIMAAEKKMASQMSKGAGKANAAVSRNAQSSEKLARSMNKTGRASRKTFSLIKSGASSASAAVTKLHNKTVAFGKKGLGHIKNGSAKAFKHMKTAAIGGAAAIGIAAIAAGSLTGTASKFEKFQTILETTEGSSKKAKAAMGWVTNFAATTPYELDTVTDSFVKLRAYGLDPTKGMLQSLGDTSAAMGKPLEQAVEAMADAVTGENERLKGFGITASKTGKKISYEYTNAAGKTVTATVKAGNRMAIQMKLMEIMNEKYAGSMKRLSETWDGMMGNIGDIWMKFQMMIMNAGLFDWMKGKLSMVLDTLNKMEADGSLQAWAEKISTYIKGALVAGWEFGKGMIAVISTVAEYLSMGAQFFGGWENFLGTLAALAIAPMLVSTAMAIMQIAKGIAMLSAAMMANPITIAIAAIAAGVYLIYANWDAIAPYFKSLWNGITAAAETAWDVIKALFAWSPIGLIAKGWSTISDHMTSPIEAGKAALGLVWDSVKTLFEWSPLGLIIKGWSGLSDQMTMPIEAGKAALGLVWNGVKTLFEWSPLDTISKHFAPIGDKISGFISGAVDKASAAWSKVTSIFSQKQDPIQMAISNPASIDRAVKSTETLKANLSAVDGLIASANQKLAAASWEYHGKRLVETLAAGIRAKAQIVVNEISKMLSQVRDHLPSSPAKVGPLSDIHKLKFAETIASSIRPAPMVRAMRAATLATMAAATPAAAATSIPVDIKPRSSAVQASASAVQNAPGTSDNVIINYNPTITLSGDAGSARDDFAKLLKEHASDIERIVNEQLRLKQRKKH